MRPFGAADLDALVQLHAEESFWWFPLRRSMKSEETSAFLDRVMKEYESEGVPALHAVIDRLTSELAGWGGLSVPEFLPEVLPAVEVAWRLGTRFRGRGYATELGSAAIRWGFNGLRLDQIVSVAEPDNAASLRVMDRLGFGSARLTSHPALGVPLLVRELTSEAWRVAQVQHA